MDWGTFNVFLNFLVLIFWLRIWTSGDSRLFFNPYVAPINRLTESMFSFFWPVSRFLSTRVLAALLVICLLALRAILLPQGETWTVVMGFEKQICPALLGRRILFSALSFAVFLFKLWGFSLIFVRGRHGTFDHAGDALYRVSVPFSDLKLEARPLALAIFGLLLAFLVNISGNPPYGAVPWKEARLATTLLRCFISALACWTTLLPVISAMIVIAIVGSWIALFSQSSRVEFICRDWLDLLLGPLRNHPVRIGMLDLTPLILIFVIQWIYPFLWRLLESSYSKLM